MNKALATLLSLMLALSSVAQATIRHKTPNDAAHGTAPGTPNVIPDKVVIPPPSGVNPNQKMPIKDSNKSIPPWTTPGALQPNDRSLPD